MTSRRLACACVGLWVLSSCISLPGSGQRPGEPGNAIGRKIVFEKREPNLLIALDRTECVVGAERFAETQEGDQVFCDWRLGLVPDRD